MILTYFSSYLATPTHISIQITKGPSLPSSDESPYNKVLKESLFILTKLLFKQPKHQNRNIFCKGLRPQCTAGLLHNDFGSDLEPPFHKEPFVPYKNTILENSSIPWKKILLSSWSMSPQPTEVGQYKNNSCTLKPKTEFSFN